MQAKEWEINKFLLRKFHEAEFQKENVDEEGGQDEGDNYWSNGSQYQLKDSFIYGFTERPTIRAFNDTFIYMADIYVEIVALFSPDHPDDAFSNEGGGRLPRSSGDYTISDLKAAIQSAFTEEERSYALGKFLGIGSQHIQLAGGHIHQGYVISYMIIVF